MTDENITQQLFQAVEEAISAGWSENQLAHAAGIPQPSLQRWRSGARPSLSQDTLTRLCTFFGMRLTKPKIRKPPTIEEKPKTKAKPKRSRKPKSERIGG